MKMIWTEKDGAWEVYGGSNNALAISFSGEGRRQRFFFCLWTQLDRSENRKGGCEYMAYVGCMRVCRKAKVMGIISNRSLFFSFCGKCTVDCWEGRVIMSHYERRCNGFESELHVGVVNVGDLISSSFGEELLIRDNRYMFQFCHLW
jgi:hypothetical protein